MPPPRPIAGQASAEYVALLAVVCAVVAGAAAVGSVPPIAAQVASAVKHGICLVAGGICTPREARAAGLAPCLVHARAERERLGGRVLVVKLGRGDSLLVQRRSDGSASVSFADGGSVGASVGLGLQLPGRGGNVRGGAGLQFTAGRTWEFPTYAAAARFVRRWGRTETLTGEVRGLLPGGDHPPPPDSTYKEGGAYGEFAAAMRGLPGVGAEARGEVGAVLGRRVARDGRVTWYHRVDAETAGRLGLVLAALERHDAGELGSRSRSSTAAPWSCASAPPRACTPTSRRPARRPALADLAARLRGTDAGAGRRRRPARGRGRARPHRPRQPPRAVGVVEIMLLRAPPADWDDRVRALAHRLDADAAVDVRRPPRRARRARPRRRRRARARLRAGYDRTEEVRDLERAWSLRAGGALQEREDCIPA